MQRHYVLGAVESHCIVAYVFLFLRLGAASVRANKCPFLPHLIS